MATEVRSAGTGSLIQRFLPYFRKYWKVLVFDLFCAALTTVCELVYPKLIQNITDTAINDFAAVTISLIVRMGGFYLILRIVDAASHYFMQSIGHIMGAKIETDMRRDIFAHLQKLDHSYYDDAKIGQIMARITSDLFDIAEFAHHCPEEFFIAFLKIGISFVILSFTNLWLTLLLFAVFPFMLAAAFFFNKRMRRVFKEQRNQIGEVNSQVEDSLLGIRVVKSFANEAREEKKFERGNNDFLNIKKRAYFVMAGFNSTIRVFDGIMYVLVIVAGGLFLINGAITPGEFVAYNLYVGTLLTSIRRIIEFTEQFQRGITGVDRFYEIMDAPIEIKDAPGATELTDVSGDVVFEDVSFRYPGEDEYVLEHINLDIKAGENVALVGSSGSGKTTLCSLIPRFYDTTTGRIFVDGKDVRSLTTHSLRSNIGMVQQDVYLFSGTVFQNIEYGRQGATLDEVIAAAKQAGAHDFISQFPDGYDTYVGERGVKLSGGQKQRISIARAFLKNPPILILDEATSALDNESERIVQQSLEQLSKGRTTFTIAHRLTTIRNASLILVLTENGIEEMGTHEELMAKRGAYYSLYYNSAMET